MNKSDKIYVAGHLGLVGSALVRSLQRKGYSNILGRSIHELNLLDQRETLEFFKTEKPDYVILAAAKVGGIIANNTYRAQFIYENLQIQNNIIHSSYLTGVKKLLFLGSSCIYPKNAPQPLKEDYLLSSDLEYTNEPYAIAKIAGIKMIESYNIQYGTNYISVMPTNLYGINDNYDLEKSHVLPALIRKMHLAKCLEDKNWDSIQKDFAKRPTNNIHLNSTREGILNELSKYGISYSESGKVILSLWGSGTPRREFLFSDDMADACVFLMENTDFKDVVSDTTRSGEVKNTHINIGTGKDVTIKELAAIIKSITGFKGEIKWDISKPDGTKQKLLDVQKINSLGWKEKISLEQGIAMVYNQYKIDLN